MGLTIHAFSGINKLNVVLKGDFEPYDLETDQRVEDCAVLIPSQDYPAQANGIQSGVYSYTDRFLGWNTSCLFYTKWRHTLKMLVLDSQSDAFRELIYFTDSNGVIGAVTSAKLLKDFQDWEKRAKEYEVGAWFYYHYIELKRCFSVAAASGAVLFNKKD